MLVKGLIHQQDMAIKTIYTSNIRPPKYMRQTLTELKGKRDRYTIIIGDFNNPLSIIGEKKQTEDQQGNRGLEQHFKPIGPNRHIQNTPPNTRIHIFLKCTGNILQDKPYIRPQSNFK